jgi:CRP-like cAMP-binding protein
MPKLRAQILSSLSTLRDKSSSKLSGDVETRTMKWNKSAMTFSGSHLVSEQTAPINFPAFAPIVSDVFEHLKDLPPARDIAAGRELFQQGSAEDSVYLLRSGLVKLTCSVPDGREMTLGLRSSGWCAGATSVLTQRPSVYSVTAITRCTVSCLTAAEFSAKLMQNTRLLRYFLSSLCNESMSQAACQVQMMGSSAEDRLNHFLQERQAEHVRLKTLDALPMLKQMELAQLLSITPEHLSRLMHKNTVNQALASLEQEVLMA